MGDEGGCDFCKSPQKDILGINGWHQNVNQETRTLQDILLVESSGKKETVGNNQIKQNRETICDIFNLGTNLEKTNDKHLVSMLRRLGEEKSDLGTSTNSKYQS